MSINWQETYLVNSHEPQSKLAMGHLACPGSWQMGSTVAPDAEDTFEATFRIGP